MTKSNTTQIAFATDQAGLRYCVFAMHTALGATQGKVTVHILHGDLSEQDISFIQTTVDWFDDATLCLHAVQQTAMQDVAIDHLYITTMTLARLLLPDLLQGRVIYLDFDIIVRTDLSELASIDLQGKVAAAVRDFGVVDMQQWAAFQPENPTSRQRERQQKASERVRNMHSRLGDDSIAPDYFNAGVLLLDCDAISQDRALAKTFRDIKSASEFELMDQDWLNLTLKDRVLLIDPKWNSFWGNPKSGTKRYSAAMQQTYAASRRDPAIIHFSGRFKPWDYHFSHYYSHRRHWIWRFHAAQWAFRLRHVMTRLRRRSQTSGYKTQP